MARDEIKRPKLCLVRNASAGEGGAGGSRTLVQTDSRGAFYMLIRLLIVGAGSENGTQGPPLSPLSRHDAGASP